MKRPPNEPAESNSNHEGGQGAGLDVPSACGGRTVAAEGSPVQVYSSHLEREAAVLPTLQAPAGGSELSGELVQREGAAGPRKEG